MRGVAGGTARTASGRPSTSASGKAARPVWVAYTRNHGWSPARSRSSMAAYVVQPCGRNTFRIQGCPPHSTSTGVASSRARAAATSSGAGGAVTAGTA
ncbi:hypothetical protein VR44_15825 [Streptomyces katrae]|uniref:Uncharacterized protein n=1 Tax=Streptomyces katrae TaxID=68223 RepID=A0A0F4JE95_9ACTN|nr:hypothetical protein VR44_15825 [Streptomyces katrae]